MNPTKILGPMGLPSPLNQIWEDVLRHPSNYRKDSIPSPWVASLGGSTDEKQTLLDAFVPFLNQVTRSWFSQDLTLWHLIACWDSNDWFFMDRSMAAFTQDALGFEKWLTSQYQLDDEFVKDASGRTPFDIAAHVTKNNMLCSWWVLIRSNVERRNLLGQHFVGGVDRETHHPL